MSQDGKPWSPSQSLQGGVCAGCATREPIIATGSSTGRPCGDPQPSDTPLPTFHTMVRQHNSHYCGVLTADVIIKLANLCVHKLFRSMF